MAEEKKTTLMKIEVDLQCHRCRQKIKKVLCKIHQIQDQVYNEKENYVVIKVVCCSPEKIKQKIKCKCGQTIKRIEEIKPPGNKPPDQKPETKPPGNKPPDQKPETKPPENKPPDQKPETKPPENKPPDQKKVPKPVCIPVRPTCCTECYEGRGGGPCLYGPGTRPWPPLTPKPCPAPAPVIVPVYPSRFRTCCTECSEGRDGGPCHYGQGRPPPCYDGYYYGRPIYDSYGGGCEETSFGCTIM